MEPASEDDWELVEIHAGHMEEQMLNQVFSTPISKASKHPKLHSLSVNHDLVDSQLAQLLLLLLKYFELTMTGFGAATLQIAYFCIWRLC